MPDVRRAPARGPRAAGKSGRPGRRGPRVPIVGSGTGPGWQVIEPRAGGARRWVAAFLSLLWPGLGQMSSGRWGKGLLLFLGQAANLVLLFATVGVVSVPLLWLWGVVDAFAGARPPGRRAACGLESRYNGEPLGRG